jgi:hypothetical protein
MEISNLAVQNSGVGDLNRWAMVQFSGLARKERQERTLSVQDNLSQLLFGVDLSPDELRKYRSRLLDVISRVEALEQVTQLQVPDRIAVPRSNMMLQVGSLGWLPSATTQKSVEVTPIHQIHSRNLAKTLSTLLSLNPKSVHQSFHTVGIVVARGGEGERYGADKVELSQWGLRVVNSRDYPKVVSLRLPPRFPSHAEMVKYRVS